VLLNSLSNESGLPFSFSCSAFPVGEKTNNYSIENKLSASWLQWPGAGILKHRYGATNLEGNDLSFGTKHFKVPHATELVATFQPEGNDIIIIIAAC
jgi:hypothetical protein